MAGEEDFLFRFRADIPGFTQEMEDVVRVGEDKLKQIGAKQNLFQGVIKGMRDAWERLTTHAEDYNAEVKKSSQIDKERLANAKEIVKQHRDLHTMKRAEAIQGAGGPGTDEIGPYGRGRRRHDALTYAVQGAEMLQSLIHSRGEAQGMVGMLNQGAQIGLSAAGANPGWGQLLNVATGIATSALDAYDRVREAGLMGYQTGGTRGAQYVMSDPDALAGLGFTAVQRAQMYSNLGRRTGVVNENSLAMIAQGEAGLGIGSQMSGLAGMFTRTHGLDTPAMGVGSEQHALAVAMGLAVGEQIGKGRMGEAFDQISRGLEQSTRAVADVTGVANRMLFISQLGPQYKGDTAASRQMEQTLQGLAGGGTAYTQLTALKAAGLGQGASYAEALLRVQTGLTETDEGLKNEDILRTNFAAWVPAWSQADDKRKAQIAQQLHQLTGINMREIVSIMNRLAKGPLGKVKHTWQGPVTPSNLLAPRRYEAAKESTLAGWGGSVADAVGPDVMGGNLGVDQAAQAQTAADAAAQQAAAESGAGVNPMGAGIQTDPSFTSQYVGGTGRYGSMREGSGMHRGDDLRFPPGTLVYAPCAGVITQASYFRSHGETKPNPNNGFLIVLRGTNITYRMAHFEPSSVKVKKGDKVNEGDLLGRTKVRHWKKTKSHLHVETVTGGDRRGMGDTDPAAVFDESKLINPQVGPAAGAGAAVTSEGPVTTPSQVEGGGGTAAAATPGVNVNIVVQDKTNQGVAVQKSVESYDQKAKQSAPGDVSPRIPENP